MNSWRQNPHGSQIAYHLFNSPPILPIDVEQLYAASDARQLLRTLRRRKPLHRLIAETEQDAEDSHSLVCLIVGSGESAYHAFVMRSDEEELRAISVAIFPSAQSDSCDIEVLTSRGWKNVSVDEAVATKELKLVLLALHAAVMKPKLQERAVSEIKFDEDVPEPPKDKKLITALVEVFRGRGKVTHAMVSFHQVRAFDPIYLRKLSNVDLPTFPVGSRMTVYWNDGHFIMSDDYVLYLQHLKSGNEEVPVAIIGPFTSAGTIVTRTGGAELVPPLVEFPSFIRFAHNEQDDLWLLREELRRKDKPPLPSDDLATWLCFAKLLCNPKAPERAIHDFIVKHPTMLSDFGSEVRSEVRLGDQYRIDLVVGSRGTMPSVYLIELEHASHSLLTKAGQESAAVTHAVQQVNDWLRWWRSNSNHEFVRRYDAVPPTGIVIIGRSMHMTADQVSTLAHNNRSRHNIQVVSYDQLLDRL